MVTMNPICLELAPTAHWGVLRCSSQGLYRGCGVPSPWMSDSAADHGNTHNAPPYEFVLRGGESASRQREVFRQSRERVGASQCPSAVAGIPSRAYSVANPPDMPGTPTAHWVFLEARDFAVYPVPGCQILPQCTSLRIVLRGGGASGGVPTKRVGCGFPERCVANPPGPQVARWAR